MIDPAIKNGDVSCFPVHKLYVDHRVHGKYHGNYIAGWWFGTFFIVPSYIEIILPIDFHIFSSQTSWASFAGFTQLLTSSRETC